MSSIQGSLMDPQSPNDGMLIRLESSTHVSALTKNFEELFLSESMVDVTLVTDEGKFIHAHKIVLAAGSQYFKNVIENASRLPSLQHAYSTPLIICLSDIKYTYLYPLIKYVYTGRVDIPQTDLKPLVKAAFHLKITGLYEEEEVGNESYNEEGISGNSPDLGLEDFIKDEQEDEENFDTEEMDELEDFVFPEQPEDTTLINQRSSKRTKIPEQKISEETQYPRGSKNRNIINENLPYQCLECGKNYTCSKSLWRHRRYTCTASVKKVTFVCKTCFKGFSRSDNLKRHTLVAHHANA